MKQLQIFLHNMCFKHIMMFFFSLMYFPVLIAQDKKVEIDIGVNKEPVWYQQPWAWIVGAAIFILLLIAILRGGKKR